MAEGCSHCNCGTHETLEEEAKEVLDNTPEAPSEINPEEEIDKTTGEVIESEFRTWRAADDNELVEVLNEMVADGYEREEIKVVAEQNEYLVIARLAGHRSVMGDGAWVCKGCGATVPIGHTREGFCVACIHTTLVQRTSALTKIQDQIGSTARTTGAYKLLQEDADRASKQLEMIQHICASEEAVEESKFMPIIRKRATLARAYLLGQSIPAELRPLEIKTTKSYTPADGEGGWDGAGAYGGFASPPEDKEALRRELEKARAEIKGESGLDEGEEAELDKLIEDANGGDEILDAMMSSKELIEQIETIIKEQRQDVGATKTLVTARKDIEELLETLQKAPEHPDWKEDAEEVNQLISGLETLAHKITTYLTGSEEPETVAADHE